MLFQACGTPRGRLWCRGYDSMHFVGGIGKGGRNLSTATRNCPTISTTRNTFQFRTRESSILASLWSWISLVSSYPTTTTKFAKSSAEEVLTADIRSCWCGGAPSNGGKISRTSPRRRLCGSGARRTGSNSARPEVTLLLSTDGFDESAGYAGTRPTPCSVVH